MKNVISLLQDNRIYFLSFLLLLCAGLLLLILNVETATFISPDASHPFWLNVFFINYTFMGDGIFAAGLISVYLFYFKKREQGVALLYAFILSAIAVQLIKNLTYFSQPRLFFEHGQYLFFSDNVPVHSSFPSGHTATAFAIATVFILKMKNKKWQLLILAAAILVGYSRMYLAQHFLPDVLVGAMIGCVSGLIAVNLACQIKGFKFSFHKMQRRKSGAVTPSFN